MKIKSVNSRAVVSIFLIFFGLLGRANATDLTGSAGVINGTVPVIYNDNNEAGKISFHRSNIVVDEDDELDINDAIDLSWKVADAEGDQETTLPTVEWICTDTSHNKHVLATGVNKYSILPGDKGCTLGVNITPTTITGDPSENTTLSIEDISTYDNTDNIPNGPVNPHSLNMVSYTLAPLNPKTAYIVPAGTQINTAYAGAQIQIETDNEAEQLGWTTSNPDIATVSDTGLVTIKAQGAFKITARHNEVKASATFNPQKFFTFNIQKSMNWYDANDWCEAQGLVMPAITDMTVQTNKREVPSGSLWQEWGSSMDDVPHKTGVYWSTTVAVAASDAYFYMYVGDGHRSSNGSGTPEGAACINKQ